MIMILFILKCTNIKVLNEKKIKYIDTNKQKYEILQYNDMYQFVPKQQLTGT